MVRNKTTYVTYYCVYTCMFVYDIYTCPCACMLLCTHLYISAHVYINSIDYIYVSIFAYPYNYVYC